MRRATTLFSNRALISASTRFNQRVFVPYTINQQRGGGSHAHEPAPPPLPLHQVATFTYEEVDSLFNQYKKFSKNNSCMVSKEQFAEFLEPLGIEQTPKNVRFVMGLMFNFLIQVIL